MIATTLENKIMQGDCKEIMRQIEPNCIDCCVTDPPYGYSFMGKDWDKAVPSVAIWKECLRVLKPGAFAFVMSSPRADVLSHMIVNLSDAGFRTDFTPIYWAYASGFPKAMNIGKMVDKKLGVKPTIISEVKTPWKTSNITKGISLQSSVQGDFTDHKEDGYRYQTNTIPTSPEAKTLDGSYGGFQPKPAVEVIIVAMKPLSEKTFVDQALKNQKGVTWLDDCRLPFQSDTDKEQAHYNALGPVERFKTTKSIYDGGKQNGGFEDTFDEKGRFPANLLVSDDCLNNGVLTKSPNSYTRGVEGVGSLDYGRKKGFGQEAGVISQNYGDEGSFSRFFSLDAWFEKQSKKLPAEAQKTFPFLIVPKASKGERNRNLGNLPEKDAPIGNYEGRDLTNPKNVLRKGMQDRKAKNFHPTVKPLQLMSYLITLGSRPNDLVLDPFVGSGTTCLAAKMLGRRFLGIELNKEYFALAEARVGNHRTLFEFSTPEACV
jgi:site-specific DNA-methyltransferase (adenine-specific)